MKESLVINLVVVKKYYKNFCKVFIAMLLFTPIILSGCSSSSSSKASIPTAPTGILLTAGNAQVTLSWNSVPGATSYNIYWSNTPGVTKTNGTEIKGVTSPYTHTGLTNYAAYYYVVTAVNSAGESIESNQVSVIPGTLAPTGVSAIAGDKQVTISWNYISGASSYKIYWSVKPGVTTTNGTEIDGAISPYTQTGLTNGTTFYYIVVAVYSNGISAESNEVSATPGTSVPPAPTGLQFTVSNAQVTLSWNSVPGATSYNIYWSNTPGVTKTNGTEIKGVTSPYTHTGLTNYTAYYYVVTAVNSNGESIESNQVSVIPGTLAPTGVSAIAGDKQVTISWDSMPDAISYSIYWSVKPGVTTTNGTEIDGAISPYTQTGLTNGTTFYYIVVAFYSNGISAESNEVSATPGTSVPTGVTAISGINSVTLSWNSVPGATSYNIYWSTSPGVTKANGAEITGVTSPYTHTGLIEGTNYYYVVTAVYPYGESSESNQVSAMPNGGATKIAGGMFNTIALTVNGTVWTSGDNTYGQLGNDGTVINSNVPVQVTGLNGVTAIAGGLYHAVALKGDGTVWTWGYNTYGQLGNGTVINSNVPVQVYGLKGVTAIAGGLHHTVALKGDGTVWTWGDNTYGQLGNGTVPVAPSVVTAFGGNAQVAISWGIVPGATSYNIYWSTTPGVTIVTGTKIAGVTSPYTHTGLTNGTPYYYIVTAVNGYGESVASSEVSATPAASGTPPSAPSGVKAAPGNAQVAISWGIVPGATSYNIYWSTTPGVTIVTGTKIAGVTSPYTHTGLTNGTPYYYIVTAVNGYGESVASSEVSATPAASGTPPLPPSVVTAFGGNAQVAISWGIVPGATSYNIYWSTTSGVTPASGTKIAGVTNPYIHTGLTNGTPYYYIVTAVNGYGESVASSEVSATPVSVTLANSTVPIQVTGLNSVTAIAAGSNHTVALKGDGTVWTWGDNDDGQLGDGTFTTSTVPVQVTGLNGITAIAAGSNHTVALKGDGTVWAWGDNSNDQLGDGGIEKTSPVPVQVYGLNGVTAIAAGGFHTIALKGDGTVWTWGLNIYGQLGNGTFITNNIPSQVPVFTGVTAIAGGGFHTIALKGDGTVWTWGWNIYGQLGNGTTSITNNIPMISLFQ